MANEDFRAKNRSGWSSGRIAFVPMSVAELYDSRLTAEEKILLLMIRYRSGRNGYTYISWETLCEDSGEKRSTLMRRIKRLRELGFLQTESRGFSKTSDKLITDPSEIYPDDIIDNHLIGKFFRSSRTKDQIDVLRSVNIPAPQIDDDEEPISPKNETSDGAIIDDSSGIHQSHSRDHHKSHSRDAMSPTGETDGVPNLGLKLDKEKLDKGELDTVRFAHGASPPVTKSERIFRNIGHTKSGETYDRETGEVLTTVVVHKSDQVEEGTRDERDAALDNAMRIAGNAASRAAEKARQATQKRLEKQERDEASGAAEERRQLKAMTKQERMTVGSRFYEWCKNEYDLFFPEVKMATWAVMEFSQLKKLLEFYGGDESLVRRGWSFLCENWDDVTKKLKIADSAPTIGLLLAFRNRIFPLVQSRKTDRQLAERASLSGEIGEW